MYRVFVVFSRMFTHGPRGGRFIDSFRTKGPLGLRLKPLRGSSPINLFRGPEKEGPGITTVV